MIKRIIGLIVIIIGVLSLMANFDIIVFNDFVGTIISLGVIIIGITGLIEKKRFDCVLFMLTIFGGLYFLSNIGLVNKEVINIIFWPTVIIFIGLSLLSGASKKTSKNKEATSYTAIFSGLEDTNDNSEYIDS